jgi:hypothetical protein
MMMIKQLQGESEESIKKSTANDIRSNKTKNSKQGKIKPKKDYPSDDDKCEVNIISLNIQPDFELIKRLADTKLDELDLFNSLDSDSDTIIKQVESKKNESKSYVREYKK